MGAFLSRVLVTGADVSHSFAVSALAVKMDVVSGRLNQVYFMINRPVVFMVNILKFFGQIILLCLLLSNWFLCPWLQNQD